MILIGLGGNLPTPGFGEPRATLRAALDRLAGQGVHTAERSRWYTSAPVPDNGQPWFTNAVARLETTLGPKALLALLLEVEAGFGRRRDARNAPRTIDLDLLAYGDRVTWHEPDPRPVPELPHPRLHERAFVLLPLAEIAPNWRHPALGRSVHELIAALPPGQRIAPLPSDQS